MHTGRASCDVSKPTIAIPPPTHFPSQTPSTSTSRYYNVHSATPTQPRRADEQYSYSYSSTSESTSGRPGSRPQTSTSTETTERRRETGPGGYSYNTDRTTTTGAGPKGYSYSSTTSGRLPYGTNYRHYSYRV